LDSADASKLSELSKSVDPYGISKASEEVAANTLLCLINQASYLLAKQMQKLGQEFLTPGGFTERPYRERNKQKGR
jgi:restriction system protein